MLEVFINFICAFLMVCTGFYIIKKIINSKEKINKEKLLIFMGNAIIIVMIHYVDHLISFLFNFIVNTVTFKIIFKNSIEESFIGTGILMILVVAADLIILPFQVNLLPLDLIQNNIYIYLISNIIVATVLILMINIKSLYKILNKYYIIMSNKDLQLNSIFMFLIIIAISGGIYNLFVNYRLNFRFFSDMIIVFALMAIGFLFINNKGNYNRLSKEYDILLTNVQNFEEWIEKEQFTRHEYKNQLAVLYAISTENSVKNKIQEIINENLNIESQVVNNLKMLPKGGLKGLLYYKSIVAQNAKVKVTADVSIKEKGKLSKLSEEKINTLAKLVGIFYDNAIEASKESRKKLLLIEVYELKNKVSIVISNTFKRTSIINNNFKKGVSSKGENRGNGLYFAKKILNRNKWIEEKHEIIDNYYIETITIKNTSKK